MDKGKMGWFKVGALTYGVAIAGFGVYTCIESSSKK